MGTENIRSGHGEVADMTEFSDRDRTFIEGLVAWTIEEVERLDQVPDSE